MNKFIKLNSAMTKTELYLSINSITTFYQIDDNTMILIEGLHYRVKETPEEILKLMTGEGEGGN